MFLIDILSKAKQYRRYHLGHRVKIGTLSAFLRRNLRRSLSGCPQCILEPSLALLLALFALLFPVQFQYTDIHAEESQALVKESKGAATTDKVQASSYTPYTLAECATIIAADLFVPGTGRLINKDYAKLSLDALRLYSGFNLNQRYTGPVYRTFLYEYQSPDLSRRNLYSNLRNGLGIFNVWDFYESRCAKNPKSAKIFLAPFQFKHFYNNPLFLITTLPVLSFVLLTLFYPQWISSDFVSNIHEIFGNNVILERDVLTEGTNVYLHEASDTLGRTLAYGIGEELLYRGIIQKELYYLFQKPIFGFSPEKSRYAAILLASLSFGAAHLNTNGFAFAAFAGFAGIFFGLAYQPRVGEFDLITPVAMHSWYHLLGGVFLVATSHVLMQNGLRDERTMPSRLSIPIMQLQYDF